MNNENNDQRILEMKKQIEKKKELLGKSSKFTPVTNCIIDLLDGVKNNINVLNKEQLNILLIKLNAYKLSANELGLLSSFSIGGYSVEQWIDDIKSKIEILSRKDEERKLKAMEEKLSQLLSEGKKVELEIDEIESMLK